MQIHIGDIPPIAGLQPEAEGLHTIWAPKGSVGYLLAALAGVLLLTVLLAGVIIPLSVLASTLPGPDAAAHPSAPTGAILIALLVYIPLHELLHLVWHPHLGLSNQSVLVLWPARLRFGVYYEGCLPRSRWLLMRAAPLLFLSLLPAVLLAVAQGAAIHHAVRTGLEVLMTVNAVGCGGDVIAMMLVLRQVPSRAGLCFRGGRAYWKPG